MASSVALRRFRLILWVLVAIAAIGATILHFSGAGPQSTSTIGQGSYTLTDQNGAMVTEAAFKGHPSLLFFGFTHCPDVCPTTLAEMSDPMPRTSRPISSPWTPNAIRRRC